MIALRAQTILLIPIISFCSQQLVLEDVRKFGRAQVRYPTLGQQGEFRTMEDQDGGPDGDIRIMGGAQG